MEVGVLKLLQKILTNSKSVKALARLFGKLAGKAAAALPGIIGSIIAGILNFLKKVVTAASEHVWLFLTSILQNFNGTPCIVRS